MATSPEEHSQTAEHADGATFARSAHYQLIAQAVALAMNNAVAQQQHAYTLLNAITTAATQAILDGRIKDAESTIKLTKDLLAPEKIVETLTDLAHLAATWEQLFPLSTPSESATPHTASEPSQTESASPEK